MSGIKKLEILLSNIEPVLDERDFVFCSFPLFDWDKIRELTPIGFFQEKEGMTFILNQKDAINKGIDYQSVYRLITLNIHSSLDAVGLTAAFSAKLAEKKH
ncbi:ACT domain-containing protein [Candidatus Bacteroides intestinigallinarum]|uniref:ACT domain-containing protein n=1 Tax=Candidatus Bacteroides intestinigallinarum TaxID=2838470 RepID=UPI0021654C26|nr:ACT domain-containing protein [Candidatus Bacteroides intestinigallinarum]MCS3200404.1 ribonuclease H [Candidatus Bacteroides intestinigallinarum]